MVLQLRKQEPFAWGGNRLCYVHPGHADRCVKVRRPDFTLEDLRRKKGFPKTLRPLSSFDDNLEEFRVLNGFDREYGDEAFRHVSKCYGFEETDLGKGLVSELVRDHDGSISQNIKQYIWREGASDSFHDACDRFCDYWEKMGLPSRTLLIHNILVQKASEKDVSRLVVIDGLGYSGIIPKILLPRAFFISKSARKVVDFRARVAKFIAECEAGKEPTYVGMNEDRSRIRI